MSNVARDENGEVVVYPMEIPLLNGKTRELAQMASVNLTSCLRHFSVVDCLLENDFENSEDVLNTEFSLASTQLISTLECLASIAYNYGIDIMHEIFDAPWEV